MHHTSESVRKVAKHIVVAYAHHIKQRIQEKDLTYLELGVDDTYPTYEALFRQVARDIFTLDIKNTHQFSNAVIDDCVQAVRKAIRVNGYSRFIENELLGVCIYDVSMFILNKAREEEFEFTA